MTSYAVASLRRACLLSSAAVTIGACAVYDPALLPRGRDAALEAAPDVSAMDAPEAGREAGPEPTVEAGIEAGMDATIEAGPDAGPEPTVEAGVDVVRPDASDGGCPGSQTSCDGVCADLNTSVSNCGACGNACPAVANGAPRCLAGRCQPLCTAPAVPYDSVSCVQPPSEACPAGSAASRLQPNVPHVRVGSLAAAAANLSFASCAPVIGGDQVFAVNTTTFATFQADLYTEQFDGAVGLRLGTCATAQPSDVCANATSLFGRETATLSSTVAANSPVFVVPKARNSTGPYALVVTATSACSNRVINGAEQCDDGNAAVGDGCDASCAYTAPLVGTCDLPVGGRPIIVGLGTQTYRPTSPVHANARDIPCGTAGVREFVTFFEPEVSGRLQLDGGPNEALAVYAVGCARAPLACAGVGALSTLNVTAGTTYALVVESPVRPAEFTLRLSRCGNGDIEGAEQCDDGNAIAGDGCTPACVREPSCQLAITAGTTFASPARPPFARCAVVPVTGTLPGIGPSITSHVTMVSLSMGDRITATLARTPAGPTAWGVEILPESAGPTALQGNACNSSRAFACASDAGATSNSVTWVSPSGGNYFVRMFSTSVSGAALNGTISVVRYPTP